MDQTIRLLIDALTSIGYRSCSASGWSQPIKAFSFGEKNNELDQRATTSRNCTYYPNPYLIEKTQA